MNRVTKIFVVAASINITAFLGMFIYAQVAKYYTKALFKEVYGHDKLFVYETYSMALNAAFYVEDMKDTSALIVYYQRLAKLDTGANYINFPLKASITLYEPIYVYKRFGKGSNIVQLIDFNKKCWGYFKAYYYVPTTHIAAPPDSLVKKEEAFDAKYNSDQRVQMINKISAKISPYGWYCSD